MSEDRPLPLSFALPQPTIQRWLSLPMDKPLEAPLTRAELDNLFFAIDGALNAQASLIACLTAYTQGDLETANNQQWETSRRLIEASNKLRQFMNAIMAGADVVGG